MLLAGVEMVSRSEELHSLDRLVPALLDPDSDEGARERRRVEALLLDHRDAAQPVAEIVAENFKSELAIGPHVGERPATAVAGDGGGWGVPGHPPRHERRHGPSFGIDRGDDTGLPADEELH